MKKLNIILKPLVPIYKTVHEQFGNTEMNAEFPGCTQVDVEIAALAAVIIGKVLTDSSPTIVHAFLN